jgi:hypothetical protein
MFPMTRRILSLAMLVAGCVLAWAGSVVADEPPVAVDVTSGSADEVFSFSIGIARDGGTKDETKDETKDDTKDDGQRALAQDMEVFGALLKETLQKLYPAGVARRDAGDGDALIVRSFVDRGSRILISGSAEADRVIRFWDLDQEPTEAVSDPVAMPLAGYGVVFTVTVPEPRPEEPPAPADAPAEEPGEKCPFLQMDRWERTRTRLDLARDPRARRCASCHSDVRRTLGDFGDDAQAARHDGVSLKVLDLDIARFVDSDFHPSANGPTKSELVDAVTELLAETGRNIRLKADERVAVVLRFREPEHDMARFHSLDTLRMFEANATGAATLDNSSVFWPVPHPLPQEAAGDEIMRETTEEKGVRPEKTDREDYVKAAEKYEEACHTLIQRLQELHKAGLGGTDPAVVNTQRGLVRVMTKLGEAQGKAGDEAAQKVTEERLKQYPPTLTIEEEGIVKITLPAGKDELAADLLLKQREYDKAVAKFEEALRSLLDGNGTAGMSSEGDGDADIYGLAAAKPRSNDQVAAALRSPGVRAAFFRLLRKIAQAVVAGGAAGGDLSQAAGPLLLLGFEDSQAPGVNPPAPSAPRLPHTLEISATKDSLDAVGGGRRGGDPNDPLGIVTMTNDQFRKAVTVREFAPQAAEDTSRQQPEAAVSGVVTEVVAVAGRQFVELSVGTDDGIRPGHALRLHRVAVEVQLPNLEQRQELQTILATAEVLFATADRAIALVLGQSAPPRRGDRFSRPTPTH